MTNQQGAPEALRLADRLSSNTGHVGGPTMDAAASELRRLHAENERLAALVEAQQPATHVQQSAEIEHVTCDVSKNGVESNMAQQPAPSAAVASKAVLAAIRAANMQLVRTGDDEFMLVTYKNAEAQCDGGKCGIGGYCEQCPAARAPADSVTAAAGGEIDRLRAALVYVAFALHGKPQYMLAEGIALIDGDTVRVSRDGWTVEASVNPARATPAARAADSVLEDAALLDFIAQHPEMNLRHRKGRWAFVGFTNYEYEMLPSLRDAIRTARKQGGAT